MYICTKKINAKVYYETESYSLLVEMVHQNKQRASTRVHQKRSEQHRRTLTGGTNAEEGERLRFMVNEL